MARQESDREDLFAELSSYSPRWELQHVSDTRRMVIGERNDGRLAVYFGPDPGFHFDGQSRLLRSYWNGQLFRTQGETLARLVRERTDTETTLLRRDLDPAEVREFRQRVVELLQTFQQQLELKEWEALREVNGGADRWERVLERIQTVIRCGVPFAPPYATKRK